MKKNMRADKSISVILRIALCVAIICTGATFLHVFDIKKEFRENMLKSYEGHVDTAVSEINYQIESVRKVMETYEKTIADVKLSSEIDNLTEIQDEYTRGYSLYYLDSNGVLYSSEKNEYRKDLFDAFNKISSYYFVDDYVCLPAKNYFTESSYCDSIIGIKKCRDENDELYYLLVRKDLSEVLNSDTFNYLNSLGWFVVIEGDGDVVAATYSYMDLAAIDSNAFDKLTEYSARTNKSATQIGGLKKFIYTKISYSTAVEGADGEDFLVYIGQIDKTHDLYYLYYFDAGILNARIKGATTRSFLICLFMIMVMMILILYIWITLNENNDIIVKLAYIDDVTGGYNYNYFRRHVNDIIQNNKETPFLMLRFDIMNFRYINESYGHEKADKVLMATIKEFEKVFDRNKELCVRVNSDQFVALVINDVNLDEKQMKYLKGISDDANDAMIKYPIRLKVGMYQIRKEDNDIDLMIDRANAARKSIDVKSNVLTAKYSDNIISNMRKVDAIESEMEKSLKNGEFRLFVQPKWDIIKDEIIGGEVLARWIKNDGTMIYPSDFIPIFESNGFIENLDFYMLEQMCIKIKEMRKKPGRYKFFPVSVNQSRVLINNPDYVKNVEKVMKRYDTDVNLIQLEITENVFFDQREKMVEVVNQLKALGLELAMDDFGSGYSSLNILKDVPFDILKIDKDFFDETFISNASTVILQKILEMAKQLNIDVICEGVETKEQVEMLKDFGCHAVQGYFYGRPMPVDEFIEKYCLIKE